MRPKLIVIALISVVSSFFISLTLMNWIWPQAPQIAAPEVVQLPPLAPFAPKSTIVTPVAISLNAIRDALDHAAPHNLSGKAANPFQQLLSDADINWGVVRGPLTATGGQNGLSITTPINGKLTVLGTLSAGATGAVSNALGNILGSAAKQIGSSIKSVNTSADIRGNVEIIARPQFTQNWRIDPKLTGQSNLGDTALNVSGLRLAVPAQIKPLIDNNISEQLTLLNQRLGNDPTLEQTARGEWSKMCRAVALSAGNGLPPLWLEIRPTRAMASQPRVDSKSLILVMGIEAESRISGAETKPSCPFPNTLALVPPLDEGRISVGVPIEMPFTQVSKLVAAQLNGRTFPEDGSAPVAITIKDAVITPAGNRLLIALTIHATEHESFLGLGGDATVNVLGVPQLDQAQQLLRLTDIDFSVESQAAFGLLGTAARAALPRMKSALADRAVIDLKPFAASALTRISATLADFKSAAPGTQVDAAMNSFRLIGIQYDNKTLRIITEAAGTVQVTINQLPPLQ